jgi:hypothetical protein
MSFLAAAGSIAAAEALAAAAMAGTTAAQVAAAAVAAEAAAAATAAGTAMAATIPTAAGIGGAMPSTASLLSGAATGIAPGVVPVGGLGALPTVAATVAPVVAEEGIKKLATEGGKTVAKEGVEGASKESLTEGNKRFLQNSVAGDIPSGGINIAKPPATSTRTLTQESLLDTPINKVQSAELSANNPAVKALDKGFVRGPKLEGPFNSGTKTGSLLESAPPKSTAYLPAELAPQSNYMNAGRGGLGSVEPSLNTSVTNLSRPVNEAGTDLMMKSIADSTVHRTPLQKAGDFVMDHKLNIALGGLGLAQMMPPSSGVNPISDSMIRPYTYSEEDTSDQEADPKGREKIRYSGSYTAGTPYKAAQGGLLSLHRGGNFLSGRGDGMSDDIPAMIGTKQPARLADGEFVIPADVVSHIGNGSSKAGAEKLYAMMDKIRQERTGRKRQSPQIKAEKYLPR